VCVRSYTHPQFLTRANDKLRRELEQQRQKHRLLGQEHKQDQSVTPTSSSLSSPRSIEHARANVPASEGSAPPSARSASHKPLHVSVGARQDAVLQADAAVQTGARCECSALRSACAEMQAQYRGMQQRLVGAGDRLRELQEELHLLRQMLADITEEEAERRASAEEEVARGALAAAAASERSQELVKQLEAERDQREREREQEAAAIGAQRRKWEEESTRVQQRMGELEEQVRGFERAQKAAQGAQGQQLVSDAVQTIEDDGDVVARLTRERDNAKAELATYVLEEVARRKKEEEHLTEQASAARVATSEKPRSVGELQRQIRIFAEAKIAELEQALQVARESEKSLEDAIRCVVSRARFSRCPAC
jgi:chromosome segregation ATPase